MYRLRQHKWLPPVTAVVVILLLSGAGYITLFSGGPQQRNVVLILPDTGTIRKYYGGPQAPVRNYLHITFDGSSRKNAIRLSFARIYMEDMQQHQDTLRGIHFHFDKTAHYEDLVKILDLLWCMRTQRWLAEPEDIWYFQYGDEYDF
ncbi:hypothetical protein ECE50_004610 [Chitinophaga sp. Mgbs1]|uniref:Uncharacterized protein n=1 Tax=Chitinophaga solisilvae TaxID=1233460 RepID=A0A9Q5CXF7_9BACT|nr:hypothetical protein [Chitinophaga solisilvae]